MSGCHGSGRAAVSYAIPVAVTGLDSLRRRALSMGGAKALDYALQFLLPVILARFLLPQEFGEYRLIWLVVMTAMLIVPMEMPGVLYFFLPRANASMKRLHIHLTLVYLAGAGALAALAVSILTALLPDTLAPLGKYGLMVPLMVVLYSVTLLLDALPTADERIGWQVGVTLSLSLLRALTLAYAAYATGDLFVLLGLLLGLLALKVGVLLVYIARYHGLGGPWFAAAPFRAQLGHAAPLGLAAGLYGLRTQTDLWVAAALFSLANFAAFSVATVLGSLVNLFRQSINHVFLPSMSRLQANDDPRGMVAMNSRANVMVAVLLFPMLTFACLFAEDLITLIYTAAYVAAAPALRVYTLGMGLMAVELYSLMLLQRDGGFVLRLSLILVIVSGLLSWQAAQHFGLPGAALGSVVALALDRGLTLRRLARTTGIGIGSLQDWPRLAGVLLCAALATALAWGIVDSHAELSSALARILVGGATLAAAYILLLMSLHSLQRQRADRAMAQS